jgi:hypothetical protein
MVFLLWQRMRSATHAGLYVAINGDERAVRAFEHRRTVGGRVV